MSVNLTPEQRLVSEWDAAKKAADKAVLIERELRARVIETIFPNIQEGADNKFDIGFNMLLQGTGVISRSLDVAAFEVARANIPQDVVESVIRYKPELSVGAWKTLPQTAKLLFADCVTEKPGASSIKIVPKKKPTDK